MYKSTSTNVFVRLGNADRAIGISKIMKKISAKEIPWRILCAIFWAFTKADFSIILLYSKTI